MSYNYETIKELTASLVNQELFQDEINTKCSWLSDESCVYFHKTANKRGYTVASELNETLESLNRIKELLKDTGHKAVVAEDSDKEHLLELALDELRIIYGRLNSSIATTRVRALTFLGAGLALLSYLYSGDSLFIPAEPYGKVFYFLGLGLVVASLSLLLVALRPNPWAVPIETKLTKLNRYKTKLDLLELMVEEYVECMMGNIIKYEKKASLYSMGFTLLLCGGILLLVIKSIGG